MITKKKIYCEWAFLKKFADNYPIINDPDDFILLKSWLNLYAFMIKADLVINISEEEFVNFARSNKWLFGLCKKWFDKEIEIDFKTIDFANISEMISENLGNQYLNAVFLSSLNDDKCEKISKDFGVFVLNNNMVNKCAHIYNECGTAIPRREAADWSFLDKLNKTFPKLKNCNSMIIVDKFLFSDTGDYFPYEEKIDYNLRPILDYLLPCELSEGLTFDLTIITGKKRDEYGVVYDYLCSVINDIRPNLDCVIKLYNDASSIFHDRSIATNYVWIDCGHGFDIVREGRDPQTSTKVTVVFPLIQSNMESIDPSFLTFVKDVNERIRFRPARIKYGQYSWGNGDSSNRIVSYYTQNRYR